MKELLVISGKGGTGKTVITGGFAALARNKVMADCDVDAADLHLILQHTVKESHLYKSGMKPIIDEGKCSGCGICRDVCRFDAVSEEIVISHTECEGCGFCSFACPDGAITMVENVSGEWYISDTPFGPLVHARLKPAEENSGKLVTLVKKKARETAEKNGSDLILIDGSPGIGCPVIASLSGVSLAVIVTEPTVSGLHDAMRVIETANHFNAPVLAVINKYDLNEEMAREMEKHFTAHGVRTAGRIAFDESVVRAMVRGETIADCADGTTKQTVRKIWRRLEDELGI